VNLSKYKIAIGQINTTVGDLDGNTEKIVNAIEKAKQHNAHLVVFPELAITGYPPKDLLLKSSFIEKNREKLDEIIKASEGITIVVGFVDVSETKVPRDVYDISSRFYTESRILYNAAAVIQNGKLIGKYYKSHLPNYDVFDESRYFETVKDIPLFSVDGLKMGVNICEDIWIDEGPTERQAKQGADFIVNISASPFYAGKGNIRRELIAKRARGNSVPIAYVNLIGGQDDLVFDGGSYVFDKKGRLIAHCRRFEEDFALVNLESQKEVILKENLIKDIHDALVLGIRDYVRKNGFQNVVIGLSGGIDSALTTALAVEALGADSVLCVLMPGEITSKSSVEDAQNLAKNLKVKCKTISISEIFTSYLNTLKKEFKNRKSDATEENIQARIRGNILMAISNKFGHLVLSTGNKSELAVGYATLYGDMAGGLAVISDVPKTMVYQLARYINQTNKTDAQHPITGLSYNPYGRPVIRPAGLEIILQNILDKEPSAELRIGQKDSDDLPPYEILDPILQHYIEENKTKVEIINLGFEKEMVEEVIYKVDHNEYKRKQAPIGIKITPKAFGFGRRMPITNKFK